MLLELQLQLSGGLLILLALAHVLFPRQFGWRDELPRLSLINRQMMKVHTLFIALTVFLMGLLCVSSAQDLIATTFGRRIAGGLALFWFVRLLVQFFGYSSELWRGKRRETIIHWVFAVVWLYLALLFLVVALSVRTATTGSGLEMQHSSKNRRASWQLSGGGNLSQGCRRIHAHTSSLAIDRRGVMST